jgi:hypothetical protein
VVLPQTLQSVSSVSAITVSHHAKSQSRRQANRRLRNTVTIESSCDEVMVASSALCSTSTNSPFAPNLIPISMSAPSAVQLITVPALASAFDSDQPLSTDLTAHLLSLSLHNLVNHLSFSSDFIIDDRLPYFDNLRLEESPHDLDSDFSRIITPYSANAFHVYLSKAHLLDRYPELCFKLTHGFPLGNITDISTSFTPGNLASASPYRLVIQKYISDELNLRRLSGPFTQKELEAKIGPFRSSPIQVDVKPGEAGGKPKFRCCRNLSYRGNLGFSVNDDINSEEFPTRWGTATECAKIVRSISVNLFFFTSICHSHILLGSISYSSLIWKPFAAEFLTLSCLKDTNDSGSSLFYVFGGFDLCDDCIGLCSSSRNAGLYS